MGIAVQHEFAHKLYSEMLDTPNTAKDPGPIENTYINPMRRQLGLAERVNYKAGLVPAAFNHSYNNNGRQLNFKLRGKDKVLRWQHDRVGGKVE